MRAITSDEQLAWWVAGKLVHNEGGECCPDFSCCQPDLLASVKERKAFQRAHQNADEETRMAMLGTFLRRAMEKAAPLKKVKVHIAGEQTGTEH